MTLKRKIFTKVRLEDCLIFMLCIVLFGVSLFLPIDYLISPILVSIPILLIALLLMYSKGELAVIKASVSWVLLGVALLTFAIFGEDNIASKSFASFLSNFATVFISLGLINIVLQLKDTKDYFANALSDLVTRESYISKLSRQQLEVLQKRVLERFFENSTEFDRENSFYRYFNKDLQKYIGSPFRENYLNAITVESQDPTRYIIRDHVSYTARSVGGQIQNDIRWKTAKNEIKEMIGFKLLLDKKEVFSWSKDEPINDINQSHNKNQLLKENFSENIESNGAFFEFNLKDYNKQEKLHIELEARYVASSYRSLTLKVIYPTFGFTVILSHPKELNSRIETYGVDTNHIDYQETINDNGIVVNYKNWLLPYSGLYIDVQPNSCNSCENGIK